MKTPDRPNSPDEQEVGAHIESCPDCSAEAQALDEMIQDLEKHKDVFCPKPWQLYELVDSGEEPTGRMAVHLDSCVKCQDAVKAYNGALSAEHPIPAPVMDAFRDYHRNKKSPAATVPETKSVLSQVLVSISSIFSIPTMALGAVAAAILVAVILYPRGETLPPLGLSSVTWEPKLRLLGPSGDSGNGQSPATGLPGTEKRPSIAFIISFKGFKDPLAQDRIDKLYEALKPTKEIKQKFDVLTPAKVKEVLGSDKSPEEKKQLLGQLKSKISLSEAVFITIEFKDSRLRIDNELIDVQTGKILGTSSQKNMTESDLTAKLRDSVFSLVLH